jgi:hypothetical protein
VPRKKSAKKSAQQFVERVVDLDEFCLTMDALGKQEQTWGYEAALIKLCAAFERLMLDALVAAINNDTAQLSKATNLNFPKHLTDEVCEYIVTGGSYFDFRGRSGLIKTLKQYLPADHYLVKAVSRQKYKTAIDRMIALRNLAAHESAKGKRAASEVVGMNLNSAGAWVKRADRYDLIADRLFELAQEIEKKAPY